VLWDLDNYFERAQYRDRLSDSEGILFDEEGTVTLQLLLKLFNGHCGHPLKFGLRELDQEEIKSEDEEAKGKEEGKESK
jgi:hypothetical protein